MKRKLLSCFLLNISDRVAYGSNLLGVLVRDLYVELLLKLHDHLNSVQRISAQISLEISLVGNLRLFYTKFISNDCFYFCFNFCNNTKRFSFIILCVFNNFSTLLFPPISEKRCKITAFFSNMQIFLPYFSIL